MIAPPLDQFQLDALDALDHAQGRMVLADPMGARKTGTTLAWLERQGVLKTLIVAPTAVHGHWLNEANKFDPYAGHFLGMGSKQKRELALARCNETASEGLPALYVTSYESMKQDQYHIERAHFDCVVFDEGHKLKGRRTQVALCANAVVKSAKHVVIVTGTPVLNHAAELWQYLHMLAPEVYPAFWKWAEAHYTIEVRNFRGSRFPTKIIHGFREGHDELVRNQIAPFFLQRDIHDLFPGAAWTQEPEHIEVPIDLSPAEHKAYESLVHHKWGLVAGKEVVTGNGLDLTTRLLQISSDWGTLNPDAKLGTKSQAAVDITLDLLERDEQVVIFAKYRATVTRLADTLAEKGVSVGIYHGDVPQADRDRLVQDFKARKVDVVVGTLDSLSEGVDGLQGCSNLILLDRHWVPAKNDQAIGRLRRSGQLRRVSVYHIYAQATIDRAVTIACLRKQNVIEFLQGKPLSATIYGRV